MRCTLVMLFTVALLVSSQSASAEERVRVALLPVVVHSIEGREYLQKGMADMLVSRLARDPRLAVIPIEDASTATLDAAAARKTGAANDAEYVVFGSFTRFGEGASLDLECASVSDPEREPRKIYVHASTMAALIPLLDGVAERASVAVVGSAPPGAGVATGPGPAPDANATQTDEERRREESLEPGPGPKLEDDPDERTIDSGSRVPGLPTDRDADPVR